MVRAFLSALLIYKSSFQIITLEQIIKCRCLGVVGGGSTGCGVEYDIAYGYESTVCTSR